MDLNVLAALLLVSVAGLLALLFSRSSLVLFMLLIASNFLGFVDPMKIAVKGVFDIHAFLLLVSIVAILLSVNKIKILFDAKFKFTMFVFFIFACYGIFLPFFEGNSTLFYSFKASKEFLTIFSYIAIFLFIKTKHDVNRAWKYLVALGIYYSVLELVVQFVGANIKNMIVYDLRKEASIFWKIYPPFWPVIIIALLHSYYTYFLGLSRPFIKSALSIIGLLLTFFRSYLLASLFAVPLTLILTGQGIQKSARKTIFVFVSIGLLLLVIGMIFGRGYESITDQFVFSAVREMSTNSGGSLEAREKIAMSRQVLLKKSLFMGYGFIDKDSRFGIEARRIIIGANLGFIDKGTIDIRLKFGYVGLVVLLITIVHLAITLIKIVRKAEDNELKARCMTIISLIIVLLVVLPVHSPFTYSYSLLLLGIALGLIDKEYALSIRIKNAT
jgi:hypothetical protein